MIEVEQKFHLKDRVKLEGKLRAAGYAKSKPIHQIDKVFLLGEGGFEAFTPGTPVTRLRTINNAKTFLTYKRAINPAGDRIEHEIAVKPTATAEKFLLDLGYRPAAVVDKMRTEYKKDDVTIALDEVKGLGSFAEVEIVCIEGSEKAAQEKVIKTASKLGLKSEDIETQKYDQLIARIERS